VALAGYLGMPHVAVVKQIDYDSAASTATVKRELEGGLVEVLRVRTPALLTIQTGINEPRYANLRAIKQARDKPLDVSTPQQLGMDAGAIAAAAGSRRVALKHPERGEGAEMIDGSPAEVAARIVEIVRERMSG
jgi:electron transfer flavoprotein beta subunit